MPSNLRPLSTWAIEATLADAVETIRRKSCSRRSGQENRTYLTNMSTGNAAVAAVINPCGGIVSFAHRCFCQTLVGVLADGCSTSMLEHVRCLNDWELFLKPRAA
jgi:hypothetical protein